MDTSANRAVRWISEGAVIAILGIGAVIAPILLWPPVKMTNSPLFPLLATGVEKLGPATLIGLAIVGLLAGLFTKLPFPLAGLATVALLPIATVCEMIADSSSHNLFPFEFVMYVVISIPVVLAAGLGRVAQRALVPRATPAKGSVGN